jgi:hypothetical protein
MMLVCFLLQQVRAAVKWTGMLVAAIQSSSGVCGVSGNCFQAAGVRQYGARVVSITSVILG